MAYGSDFAGVTDLDARWTFLEGEKDEALAFVQAVARRYVTPRAGNPWDAAYGLDLRSFVSDTASPAFVQQAINAEARKDERVSDCSSTIVVSGDSWTVQIRCTSSTGATYAFTLAVSKVSVTLLNTGN